MPTAQYTALANITLASNAANVIFDSISSSYRDLLLVSNASILSGSGTMLIKMNADDSSTTTWVVMSSDGSSGLNQYSSWVHMYTTYAHYNLTTAAGTISVNIMDYAATNKHKAFLCRSNVVGNSTSALAGRWASTSAISKLTVYPSTSSFTSGSTFALYGVK